MELPGICRRAVGFNGEAFRTEIRPALGRITTSKAPRQSVLDGQLQWFHLVEPAQALLVAKCGRRSMRRRSSKLGSRVFAPKATKFAKSFCAWGLWFRSFSGC